MFPQNNLAVMLPTTTRTIVTVMKTRQSLHGIGSSWMCGTKVYHSKHVTSGSLGRS